MKDKTTSMLLYMFLSICVYISNEFKGDERLNSKQELPNS